MKLVRYGRQGAERPGVIDADGKLRDLGRVIEDITPAALAPASLKKLRGLNLAKLPVVKGVRGSGVRWRAWARWSASGSTTPTTRPRSGWRCPKEPTLFIKAPERDLRDPTIRSYVPRGAVKLDYEVELGAGARARRALRR
jgi:hypothetical protein